MSEIKKTLAILLIFGLSAFFVLSAISSLMLVYSAHWDGPWSDMWEVMPFLQQGYEGVFQWSHLWEHYGNAHRFGVAKFIWLSDWWLSQGNNHFLLIFSCCCQLIILCTFIKVADLKKWPVRWAILYVSLLFFYLFNPSQLFNFFHTFDVQWFVVTVSAVIVCYLISIKNNISFSRLLIIFFLGVLASLCNFAGMIILFTAVFLLWWWGYPRRYVCFFLALTIAYYTVYSHGLSLSSSNVFSTIFNLEDKTLIELILLGVGIPILYPLIMLASPLSYVMRPDGDWQVESIIIVWLPYVAVALMIAFVLFQLSRQRDSTDLKVRFAASVVLYILLTIITVAIGRGMFLETAFADRFQNLVLLFWMSVGLLLFAWWGAKGLLVASLLAIMSHGLTVVHQLDRSMVLANRTALSHAALRLGVVDKLNALQGTVSKFQLIYSENYSLLNERRFLEDNQLGIFTENSWSPPTSEEKASAKACPEHIAATEFYVSQRGALSFIDMRVSSRQKSAWFAYLDAKWVALLIPKRSDQFLKWLSMPNENMRYEGFMDAKFDPPFELELLAKEGSQWCKIKAAVD